MKKKIGMILGTAIIGVSSLAVPMLTTAQGEAGNDFGHQRGSTIGVSGASTGGAGSEGFITAVQSGVNWILGLLGLITVIVLIWGGFQMVTAAGDDGKYKKGFTIVKQAIIGLILIGVSYLIVNLIFSFVNSNTQTAEQGGGGGVE